MTNFIRYRPGNHQTPLINLDHVASVKRLDQLTLTTKTDNRPITADCFCLAFTFNNPNIEEVVWSFQTEYNRAVVWDAILEKTRCDTYNAATATGFFSTKINLK